MTTTLLISYSGLLGGAERVLLQFSGRLSGRTCLACPPGALADTAHDAGMEVLTLRGRPRELGATAAERASAARQLWGHRSELAALVKRCEPDLIVANSMRPTLAMTLPVRLPGTRRLVFLHHDFVPGRSVGRVVRWAADRADLVVVPSHAVADDLRARRPPCVIHPGIEMSRFAAEGPPAQPPEVVILGALVGWKRVDLALQAIAIARAQRPELRLKVVGAPLEPESAVARQLLRRLEARAEQSDLAGAVEFLGAVREPAQALQRATCLLHCSDREPFGLAVAEALAAGRPAVVPAGSGPAEIVDAGCGITYPPGDAAAAARAILALVDDPEQAAALGARGRRRAHEQFDVTTAAQRFAAAVSSL